MEENKRIEKEMFKVAICDLKRLTIFNFIPARKSLRNSAKSEKKVSIPLSF